MFAVGITQLTHGLKHQNNTTVNMLGIIFKIKIILLLSFFLDLPKKHVDGRKLKSYLKNLQRQFVVNKLKNVALHNFYK